MRCWQRKIELMRRQSFELEGYSHGNNPIPAVARIGNLIMTGGISGIDLATGKMPDFDRGSNAQTCSILPQKF